MPERQCPQCGARLAIPPTATAVQCPRCGTRIPVASDIIDVHAEVLSEESSAPAATPAQEPEIIRYSDPSPPRGRVRTWTYQGGGGPGCCSLGCIGLILLIALAVQGIFSLF